MNKFTQYSNEEIILMLNESLSLKQVLNKIGYASNGSGGYTMFKNECKRRNIEIPKYNWYGNGGILNKRKTNNEIFVENSTYSRHNLKKRIIKENIIEYKCIKCGNVGEWQDEKLTLQLEHKNGINNDHRKENLCFLCPNCHTQTKTFGGKNVNNNRYNYYDDKNVIKKLKKFKYCECGKEIRKDSRHCVKCSEIKSRKVKRPSYEQLMKEIEETNYCAVGRKYGVSDTAIRKWVKNYKKKPILNKNGDVAETV